MLHQEESNKKDILYRVSTYISEITPTLIGCDDNARSQSSKIPLTLAQLVKKFDEFIKQETNLGFVGLRDEHL